MMIKEKLDQLKQKLPLGYAKILARDFDVKEDYVRKVLRNERSNVPIIDAAIELAKKHADKNADRLKTIDNL